MTDFIQKALQIAKNTGHTNFKQKSGRLWCVTCEAYVDLHGGLCQVSLHCGSPGHKNKVRSVRNIPDGDDEKKVSEQDFVEQEGEEPLGFADGDFVVDDEPQKDSKEPKEPRVLGDFVREERLHKPDPVDQKKTRSIASELFNAEFVKQLVLKKEADDK